MSGSNLAWFYDVLTLVIMLVCIYIGSKRGFLVSFLRAACCIVAIIAAVSFSGIWAEKIYENTLREKVIQNVAERLENADVTDELRSAVNEKYGVLAITNADINRIADGDGDFIEGIEKIVAKNSGESSETIKQEIHDLLGSRLYGTFISALPSYMTDTASDYSSADEATLNGAIKAVLTSDEAAAEYVEKNFVRESVVSMLKLGLSILIFFVVTIVISVLISALKFVRKTPVIGGFDAFLGMIFGAAQAVVILYVISLILHIAISGAGNTMMVINTGTIDATYIFRYIYRWK